MDRLTVEQRIEIIKTYYRKRRSTIATFRELRYDYGRHNRPTTQAIGKIVKKFEETGRVTDTERPVHRRNARSRKNIAAVWTSVRKKPNQTLQSRSRKLRISKTSLWRILYEDLVWEKSVGSPIKPLSSGDKTASPVKRSKRKKAKGNSK